MLYLLNAFSVNQLAEFPAGVRIARVTLDEARCLAARGVRSAVGHDSTAAMFSDQLGFGVPVSRSTIALEGGDRALLGQYRGPRLPEGVTTLPDGCAIEWFLITIDSPNPT